MYVYIYIYIHICISLSLSIYIYIYIYIICLSPSASALRCCEDIAPAYFDVEVDIRDVFASSLFRCSTLRYAQSSY